MANFLAKPKASTSQGISRKQDCSDGSGQLTDFERTFKPFVLKKDTTLAPTNWFLQPSTRVVERGGIIEIDDNDDAGSQMVLDEHLGQMSERGIDFSFSFTVSKPVSRTFTFCHSIYALPRAITGSFAKKSHEGKNRRARSSQPAI